MKPKYLFSILLLLFLIILGCGGGTDSGVTIGSSGGSGGSGSSGGMINLTWDANTESDLAGYKVHYGTAAHVYSRSIDVGKVTTYTLSGLTKGQTYFIVATAYDNSHNESGYSNEVTGAAR